MSDDSWHYRSQATPTTLDQGKRWHDINIRAIESLQAALRESQAREAATRLALGRVRDQLQHDQPAWEHDHEDAEPWDECRACTYDAMLRDVTQALASPSHAAAQLLERVASLEKARDTVLATRQADRDHWLGHVRRFMGRDDLVVSAGHAAPRQCQCPLCEAARRDLEQHDAGRKP